MTWETPWQFIVHYSWCGLVIACALWAVILTVNLRLWNFWSGD